MKPEYIDPFLNSAVSTFEIMLGCKLIPGEPFVKSATNGQQEISGMVGLSGKAKGTVILSLSREAAISASAAMLGEQITEVNGDVTDAVGELTNIIAGGAKAQLEKLALNVSLPTVIVGKQYAFEFPQSVAPVCIPYECPWGYVAVEVGLVDNV